MQRGTPGWKELVRPFYLNWYYFPLNPAHCPESFARSWQFPEAAPQEVGAGGAKVVLVFPMSDWHFRIQRTQQLSRAFSALGYHVVYLNPHLGREYLTPLWWKLKPRLMRIEPGIFELHVPLLRQPVYHHRLPSAEESSRIAGFVRALVRDRPLFLFVGLPFWMEAARALRKDWQCPLVYDCHDLLPGFLNMAPAISDAEPDAFHRSDAVVFSAQFLMEHHLARHPNIRGKSWLVRNGVDANAFTGVQRAERAGARRKVIGYVGALEDWLDYPLLHRIAEEFRDCDLPFAGKVLSQEAEALRRHENVRLLGEVPYEQVPALMASFDVGLIPFLDTPLTRAADPIKAYEYLAAGIQVVARRLPELSWASELCNLCDSADEFSGAISKALEESTDARPQRAAILREHQWRNRAATIVEIARSARAG
jgi:glycosyltransferase involved in cell wall biosynthesis